MPDLDKLRRAESRTPLEAKLALMIWNLEGDPPGPWIKQKYMTERNHPLLYDHRGERLT